MPSQSELAYKEFVKRKEALMQRKKEALFKKYGGEEHINLPKDFEETLEAERAQYVEYNMDGRVK
jgi:hypothetical protein